MPITIFWFIISLLLNTSNPVPEIEKLVDTFKPAEQQEQNQDNIHFASTVVDGHIDTMMNVINQETWLPEVNIGEDTSLHIDIEKLQKGGLDAGFFAAYTTDYYGNTPRNISRTLALLHALYWTEENNTENFKIASTSLDVLNTVREGKTAAIPSIEGGYSFDETNAIGLLHQYYDLGVKAVGFNWNYSNALSEGANEVYNDPAKTPSHGGLTELGEQVAAEMNKLGMIIDVSHMAESAFWDVIETTEAPIMATHSGVKSLHDHQRNLSDEQLKALAENGGVVGIVFYPEFLTGTGQANVKDVVDHIDYAVNLIGVDHVALGSDFDGSGMPADIKDVTDLPKITNELIDRGYSNEDIEKILGKNTLRLLMDVEQAAEVNPYSGTGNELVIQPDLEMGEKVDSKTPSLSAAINAESGSKIDPDSLRIIVDGISYNAQYDSEKSISSIQLKEPLQEKFHVVTFEAATEKGEINRETRIFYIETR
ncbi:dipeptidase [Oceanobacillus massiliensis]|uniref:dipeptidase n=1 Tax=Oceanobacillus massiliensis TaxID=1465765 RepID=UPI0002890100|nr:dipeptidase [Oceanobacillus massiliensis]